jgi:hypothetical protein
MTTQWLPLTMLLNAAHLPRKLDLGHALVVANSFFIE